MDRKPCSSFHLLKAVEVAWHPMANDAISATNCKMFSFTRGMWHGATRVMSHVSHVSTSWEGPWTIIDPPSTAPAVVVEPVISCKYPFGRVHHSSHTPTQLICGERRGPEGLVVDAPPPSGSLSKWRSSSSSLRPSDRGKKQVLVVLVCFGVGLILWRWLRFCGHSAVVCLAPCKSTCNAINTLRLRDTDAYNVCAA